jgi:uncharacterized damage-inducible protein DinB
VSFPEQAADAARRALTGEWSHVSPTQALEGLDWRTAGERPGGSPYSVFRVLNHMVFWQEIYLDHLRGQTPPPVPHDIDGWPGSDRPASAEEWAQAIARFQEGLGEANALARAEGLDEPLSGRIPTRHDALHLIASHNGYHVGQIVLLRRMLVAWPPPGGGDTW